MQHEQTEFTEQKDKEKNLKKIYFFLKQKYKLASAQFIL